MTLLIAFLILGHIDASGWAYFGTFLVWCCHVAFHAQDGVRVKIK